MASGVRKGQITVVNRDFYLSNKTAEAQAVARVGISHHHPALLLRPHVHCLVKHDVHELVEATEHPSHSSVAVQLHCAGEVRAAVLSGLSGRVQQRLGLLLLGTGAR